MDLDFTPVLDSGWFLLGGLGLTLALSVLTIACSLLLGGALGLARCYGPGWLRWPIVFYIDSMRAVPVLVVLVWTYFALPIVTGVVLPPFWAALVALSAHISAYVAEIVRAGIAAVPHGQSESALALGLTRFRTLRFIVYPQALRIVAPSLASLFSQLIKDSSLASVITVSELSFAASAIESDTFRSFEIYITVALIYLMLVMAASRLVLLLPGAHRPLLRVRFADA